MNLNWTNLPIKGSYLPFLHYLLYSHNSNNNYFFNTTDSLIHYPDFKYGQDYLHYNPNGISKKLYYKNSILQNQFRHQY